MKQRHAPGSDDDSYHYNEGGYGSLGYGGYGYGGYAGYGYGGEGEGAQQRSIRDYLLIVRERFWWLVSAVFVVFIGSVVHTVNSTPVFLSSARVQVLRIHDQVVKIDDIGHNQVVNTEDFQTQINLIESIEIVKRVYDRLSDEDRRKLMQPYEPTIFQALSPMEVLFNYRKVLPMRGSLMVAIQFSHPDAQMAARVANLFSEEFIDYNIERRTMAASRGIEDLKRHADQQEAKIGELQQKIADFKKKHKTVSLSDRTDIDTEELKMLNNMLTGDQRVLDEAETQWNMVESFREQGRNLWDLTFIAAAPQVTELLNRVADYKIAMATLGKRYRAKHPQMVETQESLDQTLIELQAAVNSATQKIETNLIRARQNHENSLARIARKKDEIIQLEKLRIDFAKLQDELGSAYNMHRFLMGRIQEVLTTIGDPSGSARIIDHAVPAPKPYKPNHIINLALGLFGGIALGLGLIFLVAFADDRVKTAFDIESAIGLPIIGLIPRIKSMGNEDKAQVVANRGDKQSTESFRTIHSTLKLSEESRKAKCILTTSTVPGEGKSFVSTNLGMTYAAHGEKTLVLDCDLRMPNVAKSLGLDNERGVLDHFERGVPIEELIRKDVFPNLDVLTTGGRSKNPTQVLSMPSFEELIHDLRMRYDRIIIDTPPLAPVSDALNILPLVDGVLYVIRFNSVKRKTAKTNVRRLWESDVPVFGAILNNINANIAHYYYSQYYDKSYKDYYLDDGADDEVEVAGPKRKRRRGPKPAEEEEEPVA